MTELEVCKHRKLEPAGDGLYLCLECFMMLECFIEVDVLNGFKTRKVYVPRKGKEE